MFQYRLQNPDGTPAVPPTFTSSEPNWRAGDTVLIRPGHEYRILRADPAADVQAVWTVEPVQNGH